MFSGLLLGDRFAPAFDALFLAAAAIAVLHLGLFPARILDLIA